MFPHWQIYYLNAAHGCASETLSLLRGLCQLTQFEFFICSQHGYNQFLWWNVSVPNNYGPESVQPMHVLMATPAKSVASFVFLLAPLFGLAKNFHMPILQPWKFLSAKRCRNVLRVLKPWHRLQFFLFSAAARLDFNILSVFLPWRITLAQKPAATDCFRWLLQWIFSWKNWHFYAHSLEWNLTSPHIAGERNEEADALSQWNESTEPPFQHLQQNRFPLSLSQLWHPEVSVAVYPPETFCHGNFHETRLGINNRFIHILTFSTAGIQHILLRRYWRLYPTSLIDILAENNHQSGVKTFGHEMHVQMDGTTINNSGSRKRTSIWRASVQSFAFSYLRFGFYYLNNK